MGRSAYVDQFRARVVQDALSEATADYWLRRAETFEAARHRPGVDYAGNATLDVLRARWVELTEVALACRNRASVAYFPVDIEPEEIRDEILLWEVA